jgi:hypothetical protein
MPEFRSFLEKYCKQHIPYELKLRKYYLRICYEETLKNIRGNIRDAFIWVAVDETTDSVVRFQVKIVAGNLDIEVPCHPYLICFKVLQHTNYSIVVRFVNDGLEVLWLNGVQEEKVIILYSSATAYMLEAATKLKGFTCLPHGLQRGAEEVKAKFLLVNKLISMLKKCF